MRDERLQMAFGGMHPDRMRLLYEEYGPKGAINRIGAGAIKTNERIREAVAVPAADRRSQLAAANVAAVYRGDEDYPGHLGLLPDAPDVLFVRGRLPGEPGVAVVGTRRCTSYGRRIAEEYGAAVAAAGWPLVSGLARGVDGAAHRGTVKRRGIGVAVLGSGVDVMYPREHRSLALDLLECGGAVISESPPGAPPEAWRFPPRNRIISGLGAVVVVVEATVKGGALITADAALRHGRQVFAVPGDVGRSSSAGCNLLIRDGAFPVTSPDDLVESLELVLGPAPAPSAAAKSAEVEGVDRAVLDRIAAGAASTDDLISELGIPAEQVLTCLSNLEVLGMIRRNGVGRYSPA